MIFSLMKRTREGNFLISIGGDLVNVSLYETSTIATIKERGRGRGREKEKSIKYGREGKIKG